MSHNRYRRFQASLALWCIVALLGTFAPGSARTDLSGVDAISKWVAAMPASCAFRNPPETYWVGDVLKNDYKQFPMITLSEWIRRGPHGQWYGTQRIGAVYDSAHKIAMYLEFGNDISNRGLLTNAPAPPAGTTQSADLSKTVLAGDIHIGDTVSQVAREIQLNGKLHPSVGAGACKEFSMVGLCSWNRKGCECPERFDSQARAATVVFRNGRVVALFWDNGCAAAD